MDSLKQELSKNGLFSVKPCCATLGIRKQLRYQNVGKTLYLQKSVFMLGRHGMAKYYNG